MIGKRLPESMKEWNITGELGQGSAGQVYLLSKQIDGQTIYSALKVIRVPRSEDEYPDLSEAADKDCQAVNEMIAKESEECKREITSMQELLDSPYIVDIQEFQTEKNEEGPGLTFFIRMEYLKPLTEWKREHVTKTNTLEEKNIIKLAEDICRALIACEEKGIVHRDIKPENIFWSDQGNFKLGDFGIARFVGAQGLRATRRGTPRYIAPEIENCQKYDCRADLYSLGVMLYELANRGRIPFENLDSRFLSRDEKEKAIESRMKGAAITRMPVDASAPFSQVILKMLAYRPDDRYRNATELLQALQVLKGSTGQESLAERKTDNGLPTYAVFMEKTTAQMEIESDRNVQYLNKVLNEARYYLRKAYEFLFTGNPNWNLYLRRLLQQNKPKSILPREAFLAACETCGLFADPETAERLAGLLDITPVQLHHPAKKVIRKLDDMVDSEFYAFYDQLSAEDLSADSFIREALGKMDFNGFCSAGEQLVKYTTVGRGSEADSLFFSDLRNRFPNSPAKARIWIELNQKAREIRNKYSSAHTDSDSRFLWEEAANAIKVPADLIDILACDECAEIYKRFRAIAEEHENQCRYFFVSLDELMQTAPRGVDRDMLLSFIEKSDRNFQREQLNLEGWLFCCNWDYLAIRSELERIRDLLPDGEENNRQMIENFVQEGQSDIPVLSTLTRLNAAGQKLSASLTDEQLQELFATHHIICDTSFLSSESGRLFLQRKGEALLTLERPLLITTTAQYLLAFSKERQARAGYATFRQLKEKKIAGAVGVEPDQHAKGDLDSICQFLGKWRNVRLCLITEKDSEAQALFNQKDFPYLVIAKATKPILKDDKSTLRLCISSLPLKQRRTPFMKTFATSEIPGKPQVFESPKALEKQKASGIPETSGMNKAFGRSVTSENKPKVSANREEPQTEKAVPVSPKPKKVMQLSSADSNAFFDEDGSPVRLIRKMTKDDGTSAEGGEGAVWETDKQGLVAKIYHSEDKNRLKQIEQKLKAIAPHWPDDRRICRPKKLLYDRKGQYAGFLMKRVPDGHVDMSLSLLKINNQSEEAKYPERSRLYLVRTAHRIADLLAKLHENGILMGDLNPNNILISRENPEDLYFVDCDSYQFGSFPSGVGVKEYTPPMVWDRYGKKGEINYNSVLRTEQDENYIFALIVFQILFCGASPFTNKQGLSQESMMKERNFFFLSDKRDIPGKEIMIWQNLPKRIQTMFTSAFVECKPAIPSQWRSSLSQYADWIKKGMNTPDDPQAYSNELYPRKYREFDRNNPYFTNAVCLRCGEPFNYYHEENKKVREFCRECEPRMNRSQELVCETCGKKFMGTYATAWKKKNGMYEQILCLDCRPRQITCDLCGKNITMKGSDITEFQKKQKMILCRQCRGTPDNRKYEMECGICGKHAEEEKAVIRGVFRQNGKYICPDHRIPCSVCGAPSVFSEGSSEAVKILSKGHRIFCDACNPFRQSALGGYNR